MLPVHHAGDRCGRPVARLTGELTGGQPRRAIPYARCEAGIQVGEFGLETGFAGVGHSRSNPVCGFT